MRRHTGDRSRGNAEMNYAELNEKQNEVSSEPLEIIRTTRRSAFTTQQCAAIHSHEREATEVRSNTRNSETTSKCRSYMNPKKKYLQQKDI